MTSEPSVLLYGTLIVLTSQAKEYQGVGLYVRFLVGCAVLFGLWYAHHVSK